MPTSSVEPPATRPARARRPVERESVIDRRARARARRRARRHRIAVRRAVVLCVIALDLIAGAIVGHGASASPGASALRLSASHGAKRHSATGMAAYINPLRAASSLDAGRIDMGVDYAGSGPVLALGEGRVTFASNTDAGPASCYGRTCWPAGGVVVYRLSDGPFAGKYVYVAESITVDVAAGQTVRAGAQIATMHDRYPDIETGWASGRGPEALAIADGHECTCGDPGGWSTIEGRNFDRLMTLLGAPSGDLQPDVPKQAMPAGWPELPGELATAAPPVSSKPLPQGSTSR